MATGVTSEGEPYDLGEFRWVVAAYIRYMIRARLIDEPDFLPEEELARWGLNKDTPEEMEKFDLLWRAKQIISEEINHRFIPRCGSGGICVNESELNSAVAFFADHLHDLPEAIRQARAGEPIAWDELARWDDLDCIREELDKLPHPNVEMSVTPDVDEYDLQILSLLRKANRTLTQTELESGTGITRKTINKRLEHLRREKLTKKGVRGELLTEKGRQVVRANDPKTTQ